MNSFNQTIRNFTVKIVIVGISLVVSLFIPGILGPKLFGLYTLIIVWVGFLIPITSIGIGSGIVYYISNKSFSFQSVFSTNVVIAGMIGTANSLLLLVFKWTGLLAAVDPNMDYLKLSILAISIFFQSGNYVLGRAFLGNSDFDKLNSLDLVNTILNPVLLLIVLWYLGIQDSAFIYISYGIVSIILFATAIFLLRNQIVWDRIHMNYLRNSFRYGLKSWIGDVALRANLRVDQIILGSFISLNALGIYSIAVKLVEMIWLIPDTVGPVLFNALARGTDKNYKLTLLSRMHRLIFITCFLVLVMWIIICYVFVIPYFLGSQYKDAIKLVLLLAPGTLLLISSKIITKLFSASGEVQWTSQITVFGGVISILIYLVLIPMYGSAGAAIASSLGYFSLAMAGIYVLKSNYPFKLKQYFFIQIEDLLWLKDRLLNLVKRKALI